jgi:molecular chaperone HtpG
MFGGFPDTVNVVVNANHALIGKIIKNDDKNLAKQLYDLALLSQGMLNGSDLTQFIRRSVEVL